MKIGVLNKFVPDQYKCSKPISFVPVAPPRNRWWRSTGAGSNTRNMEFVPKGKLIAIGGAEDKGNGTDRNGDSGNFVEKGILRRVVDEMGGPSIRIALITTASSIPVEVAENYQDAFGKLGVKELDILDIRERADVTPEMASRLEAANGVMISGGNQLRLTTIFGGTEFLKVLKRRYREEAGFVIAGTSAGAMCMSSTMIYQGQSASGLVKGGVKMTTGLGLVNDVVIDTHFVKRGRFSRLTQTIAANPTALGVGLGEDTGVVITNGDNMESIGSGQVMIFDGHDISYSNLADVDEGDVFSIEGMRIHIISKGHSYSLSNRKFTATPKVVHG